MVPDDPTSASGVWELPTPKSVSREGRGQQGELRCFLLSSGIGPPALRWGLLPSIAQEGQRCYPRKDGGGAVWPAHLGKLRVQEGPFLHHLEGIHWSAPGTSQSLSFNLTVPLQVASGMQATCMSPRFSLPFTGCSRHGEYKGVGVERCLRLVYSYSIIISFSVWLWASKKILKP